MTLFISLVVLAVVLAWNFYPPFRDKLRGLSTIIEGLIGVVLSYVGILGGALEEANSLGYIPDNWQVYVPAVLLGWVVLKRWQTTTRLGSKDD